MTRFYIENDYYVKINQLDGRNGCVVSLPANIIFTDKKPVVDIYYIIIANELIVTQKQLDSKPIKKTIVAPPYCLRPLIISDVLVKVYEHGLHSDLIVAYDNKGKLIRQKRILGLLDPPLDLDNEEAEKEKELIEVLSELFVYTSEHVVERHPDIADGCELVCNLIMAGGI